MPRRAARDTLDRITPPARAATVPAASGATAVRRAPAALLRAIEAMAVRGNQHFWNLIPPEVAHRLRPHVEKLGDGLLTLSETSDALRLNRVIGLGHRGRATEAMIDRIVARARAARLRRFGFLTSPGPQARAITGWLLARGFKRRGGITLLVRDTRRNVPRLRAAVRVKRARRADGATVVDIQERGFGSPASRRPWELAALAIPGTEHYLAWVGREPVAAGALRFERDLAWLCGGATLTPWRRHGAHSALIVARLRRARRRGCRWVWVETSEPVPGRPSGSYRNLLRLGFEPVAVKPSYVWSAGAGARRR